MAWRVQIEGLAPSPYLNKDKRWAPSVCPPPRRSTALLAHPLADTPCPKACELKVERCVDSMLGTSAMATAPEIAAPPPDGKE